MLAGGCPNMLEHCPVERVSSIFNSELNQSYRIPCSKVPTVLPELDS